MTSLERKLGRRIAQQRQLAGLTQAQLAEKIGIEPETLSRLETGVAMPSLARVEEVAEVLGIELRELFRLRPADRAEDEAIDRLVWLVSRRSVQEIELVTDVAARILAHCERTSNSQRRAANKND